MLSRWFGREKTDAEKKEFIETVRSKFEGENDYLTDGTINRFCIAREWDEAKTVEMLTDHLKWRKETLPVERTPAINRVLESGRLRILRKGKLPVLCVDFMWGNFLLDDFKDDDIIAAQVALCEEALAEADAASTPDQPGQYITVSTGGPPPMAFVKKIVPVFDINYPERTNKAIIYPIPTILSYIAWAILKLVPERTRKKFILLSEEDDFCKETGMSPEELPEDLKGGIEANKARRDEAMKDDKRMAQMPEGFKDAVTQADTQVAVSMSQAAC